jgi:lipopolysaccharide transport system permease protein
VTGSLDSAADGKKPGAWVLEPRPDQLHRRLLEIWRNRKLLAYFSRTSMNRLTKRTLLGRLWLIIRPGMLIVPNLLFFMLIMKVDSGALPYPLFFLGGFIPWLAFDQALMWCTRSVEINRSIIRKMYFPRLLLPIAYCTPSLVFSGIALLIYALAVIGTYLNTGIWHVNMTWNALWFFPALVQIYALGLGVGLWTAVWGARFRDVRFTLRYVSGMWFMVTPVAYAPDTVTGWLNWFVRFNPVSYPVNMIRDALLGGGGSDTPAAIVSLFATAVLLLSGLWYFLKSEADTADKI